MMSATSPALTTAAAPAMSHVRVFEEAGGATVSAASGSTGDARSAGRSNLSFGGSDATSAVASGEEMSA
jgi:hypothetical protein